MLGLAPKIYNAISSCLLKSGFSGIKFPNALTPVRITSIGCALLGISFKISLKPCGKILYENNFIKII